MMKLLIREHNKWYRKVCFDLLIGITSSAVMIIIYFIASNWATKLFEILYQQPDFVYSFLGLGSTVSVKNVTFYLMYSLMLTFFWLTWRASLRVIRSVHIEETTGSVYYLCNQLVSRKGLLRIKLLWALISTTVVYLLLFIMYIVIITLVGHGGIQCVSSFDLMLRFGLGLCVSWMFQCISFLYAVNATRSYENEASWFVNLIVFIPLIIGNVYKVSDAVLWLINNSGKNVTELSEKLSGLQNLVWLSPMSWLNPFTSVSAKDMLYRFVICLVTSAVTYTIAELCYNRRKLI